MDSHTNDPEQTSQRGALSQTSQKEAPSDQPAWHLSEEGDAESPFLLAEDNSVNIKVFGILKKRLGISCALARNGQEAVDIFKARAGQFKCIFMDVSMPVKGGFDATRLIRAYEEEQKLERCFIFGLSASIYPEPKVFECGMDAEMRKPIRFGDLRQNLESRNFIEPQKDDS